MGTILNSDATVYKNYNVQPLECNNSVDESNNPTGGTAVGKGLNIAWQNGGRKLNDGTLADSNGAFVEDVIYAALQRLQFFQESKFKTRENAIAITNLEEALWALNHRRLDRQQRGVEGAYTV